MDWFIRLLLCILYRWYDYHTKLCFSFHTSFSAEKWHDTLQNGWNSIDVTCHIVDRKKSKDRYLLIQTSQFRNRTIILISIFQQKKYSLSIYIYYMLSKWRFFASTYNNQLRRQILFGLWDTYWNAGFFFSLSLSLSLSSLGSATLSISFPAFVTAALHCWISLHGDGRGDSGGVCDYWTKIQNVFIFFFQ